MFEVRVHGRGGQGVVTAAELLSVAAFSDGRNAQAFPSFGSERMGAPVVAYCRIADRTIRTREPVVQPDAVIVQDATLLADGGSVFGGLPYDGYVIVNSARRASELGIEAVVRIDRIVTLPATQIALDRVGRPVPNAVLLGAFAALTGQVSLGAVLGAIRQRFGGELGPRNASAALAAYSLVGPRQQRPVHA